MLKQYDVLVAGEINPDLILELPSATIRFDQQEVLARHSLLTIGSSNVIFACGAARLGLKVAFIGVVGKDIFGDYMLAEMDSRGIDTAHVILRPDISTGFSVILNHGQDRSILTSKGAISALTSDDFDSQLLAKTRHFHVASYFLQLNLRPSLPALFREARRLGASTSLDTNWDPKEKWHGVKELLAETTLFFPNENEACSLAKTEDAKDAAKLLADFGPVVAVKLGPKGALLCKDGNLAKARAIEVAVADTVGAGDTFDAGFVYGYLQDWSLQRCLEFAAVCGSLSTRKHGGTEAQPMLDEALRWI